MTLIPSVISTLERGLALASIASPHDKYLGLECIGQVIIAAIATDLCEAARNALKR